MATITKDLGVATAYGYAVAGGYTGTEEEFAELMAAYADVAQEAEESAETAEAYAKGTVDGTPVGSGETGYHDNAKYYAEQASGSATNADNSATAASGSASGASASALKSEGHAVGQQNGSDVGSGSPYYHNNAKYYKEQASGSASAASGSAGTAADQALVSEGYAKGTQSGTPVASGTYYHDNAKYYKEQADGDASSASASATAANTDALKAEGFAVGKQNGTDVGSGSPYYENNAKHYASEAADSATEAAASAASIDPDTLAKVDGYYESMTVGNAEQLVATVGVEDSTPFNFRTTGGSADVGDRKTMEVVGGTVAFNQQIYDGDFASDVGWNILSAGTQLSIANNECAATINSNFGGIQTWANPDKVPPSQRPTVLSGHKYFVAATIKASAARTGTVGFGLSDYASNYQVRKLFSVGTYYETYAFIGTQTSGNVAQENARFMLYDTAGSDGITLYVKNLMAIDLTQMFGSTIADYIYSLETANAGAGVAWFRKLFPKPYYAYNAGELMSVKTSAYKTTGFNQWDEEWVNGNISDSDGSLSTYSGGPVRSKNYIPIVPNTSYYCDYIKTGATQYVYAFYFYDANKNYIGYRGSTINGQFATPSDACYMMFRCYASYGTTYNNDICINLSWDGERDGEYEPYEAHTYALDSDLELRGIPKLDADNQLYYDGDIYESDGAVGRRFGKVTLDGTEGWHSADSSGHCWMDFNDLMRSSVYGSGYANFMIATVKIADNSYSMGTITEPVVTGLGGTSSIDANYLYFAAPNVGDTKEEVEAYLAQHPVTIVYLKATPTTETADPFQTPQIVNDFGTEEFVDTRTIPIPVGHNSKYQANLRAKLEMAPNSPSGDGDYIVRQSGGQNTYVPITFPADELPAAPTTDGNYVLKCTVSSGTATFTWEAQT